MAEVGGSLPRITVSVEIGVEGPADDELEQGGGRSAERGIATGEIGLSVFAIIVIIARQYEPLKTFGSDSRRMKGRPPSGLTVE